MNESPSKAFGLVTFLRKIKMKKILMILSTLSLFGCATQATQTHPVMVTATILAPSVLNMGESPANPQMQAKASWEYPSIANTRMTDHFWIYVTICSLNEQGNQSVCVPSIGEVSITPTIASDNKLGIVDVEIALSNDATIQTKIGGLESRMHKHVGASPEITSYGTLKAPMTIDLIPGAVRTVELKHGIKVVLSVDNSNYQH